MDIEGLRTLYVAHLVDLPPLTAAAAFDAVVPGATPASYAIRRAFARLALSRHISVGIELELVRWSRTSCEVGLRPLGRAVPFSGGWRHRRYCEAAGTEVLCLVDAMAATVDGWTTLAWAVDTHPSRSVAEQNWGTTTGGECRWKTRRRQSRSTSPMPSTSRR